MTYYDHATAMALELDSWGNHKILRNYEREAIAGSRRRSARIRQEAIDYEQQRRALRVKKPSILDRGLSIWRSLRVTNSIDTP